MRLQVGRIGRAHGIHGEATIEVRTDDPDSRFAIGARLETDDRGVLTVKSGRVHNGILLLSFEGFDDRTAVDGLRDVVLYAHVDIDAPGESDDDFHVQQLLSCSAYGEDGSLIGQIIDVLNLPGQDVLVIKSGSHEIMVPFVREFVPTVDIQAKRIVVIPPSISGVASED